MLNNGITSLTCIHCEAGIKPNVRGGKKQKMEEEGKDGRRDSDESEVIKNRSASYLWKKWKPQGEKVEKDEEGGSGGDVCVCVGGDGGRQSDVFNFFCC